MINKFRAGVLVLGLSLSFMTAGTIFAAHPLITDDAGTLGKGKAQLEIVGEYGVDTEKGVTEKKFETPTVPFLSYGLSETSDLVFGLPYTSVQVQDEGMSSTVRGATDLSIEVKARVYEKDGFNLAVKPGISLPTGDEEKGLGNGKVSYSAIFITTRESGPWAFHLNVGYLRNEYKLQTDEDANRKDLWHVSIASQVEVARNVNFVANIGMERNPDRTSSTAPAFILGGFCHTLTDAIDLDFGIKNALNKPETDLTFLGGITWKL